MRPRYRQNKLGLIVLLSIAIYLGWFCLLPARAQALSVGQPAPFFSVESGTQDRLTLDMVKGKVIVLFYETKEMVKKNKELKDNLTEFYHSQPEAIQSEVVRLVVIKCTSAQWPTTIFWKNKLYESSRRQHLTIYGDWTGKMFADYQMRDNESNFIIIDKESIVRFVKTGKVETKLIPEIKDLLLRLVKK
ncbi:MAG: redoxin domain-containing protein [Deltaproteobacteria bacterium]|nr:redoxin domain-containing protein [Deltaproteobacteria bacterium]MBW1987035.1 redoxin domain-containing protein [Deltaproteobacteria bacterium]